MNEIEVEKGILQKEERLKRIIGGYVSLAVAYSGGVDSTYLADVANDVLGPNAHVLLGDSPSVPRSEVAEASELAALRGWNFQILRTNELEDEAYLRNDGTRCYFCRTELFKHIRQYAQQRGVAFVAYGEITDDMIDTTRKGAAAARESGVVAPLVEAQLSKSEIRRLSARRNLPTADKPSFACLSSRFPVGTRVTVEDLRKVEQVEEGLKRLGFRQYRARHHGDLCRIEVDPQDITRLVEPALREQVVAVVRGAGYRHVALDLSGYRTGSTA